MEREDVYVGFPPLLEKTEIVNALVTDPPEVRWRLVRDLFQIKHRHDRNELIGLLRQRLDEIEDMRVKSRIILALQALHRPLPLDEYLLVNRRGAFHKAAYDPQEVQNQRHRLPPFLPVVDFHIHPKTPDLKFLSDMREAGITHGVVLATDTDPEDLDRPEIRHQIRSAFDASPSSHRFEFESLLRHIRDGLFPSTQVTNQDVADWVSDYPDILIGFGSVNLSKGKPYVRRKLDEIERLGLRGIKFLPHAQFFNPAENEHMERVFDFCRQTGRIVLTHAGCGNGPFELLEMSQNSRPIHWETWLKKYPEVPVVLSHFGAYSSLAPGIWLFDVLQLGKKYPNVYADLAAVDWILDRKMVIQEIRKTIGFNRVLFATDYPIPLNSGVSWAYLVEGIQMNKYLTQKEKIKILGQNAAYLLGLT